MASHAQLLPRADTDGPPYIPSYQDLGGEPTILPDVPVNAVFLALFVVAAAANMTIFQINLHKKGKKFVFNAAIFGYCMTRILATSLRIAWAYHPRNIPLAIAAQIFVYAGVPILFVANLFFAQRIVRAQHPNFGWSGPFSIWLPLTIALMIVSIIALIIVVVLSFYLPQDTVYGWTRAFEAYGEVMFAFFAVLSIPIVVASWIARQLPSIQNSKQDSFGKGSTNSKIIIVIISAIPLALGAWYRAALSLMTPIGVDEQSPWYFSKVCFYVFNFTMEILVVYFWLIIRIDKRFIISNGADRPMSYAGGFVFAGEYPSTSTDHLNRPGHQQRGVSTRASRSSLASTIIPPPTLSRVGSWGSLQEYMSRGPGAKQSNPSLWGGISTDRVDSTLDEQYRRTFSADQFQFELTRAPPVHSNHSQLSQEMGYNPSNNNWDVREWQMMGPSVYDVRVPSPIPEMPSIFSPSAEHIPSYPQSMPPRVYEPTRSPKAKPSILESLRSTVRSDTDDGVSSLASSSRMGHHAV